MEEISTPPFKDRIIPWYFVMAFMVVFAVNGLFVYLATHTHTGVVTENAYEQGLNYDRITTQAKKQESLGWTTDIGWKNGTLSLLATDAEGRLLENATVIFHIARPTQSGFDATIQATPSDAGRYVASYDFPMNGQWDITAVTIWKQQEFQKTQRVVIK